MGYFSRNKGNEDLELEKFIEQVRSNAEKKDFYLHAVRALLLFIKDFSMDIKEIGSDRFSTQIDDLSEIFITEEKTRSVESIFDGHKKTIPAFIGAQKDYLRDREKQLRDIVDILRNAMKRVDTENRDYNRKMYVQSEKIEAITMLDDIKTIKKNLRTEVEEIQTTVRTKQEKDKERMKALAGQISSLNVELKKAKTKSMTDGLTGAYNRKAFDGYMRKIVDRNTVSPSPFSLLLLDIDDFKKINDTYGHQIGDRVLITMVEKCGGIIRSADFLARYGGEEFAIILPGASLKNAAKKARRIRKAIAGTRYKTDKNKKGEGLSITVSIGVSSFRKSDSVSTVIARADKALYLAKDTGKNRVITEESLETD